VRFIIFQKKTIEMLGFLVFRVAKNFYFALQDYVRFEVFTAVTMKNAVFWDVRPCGSYKNRHFGGTCSLRISS
jgi:hypothetical protein